MFPRSTSNTDHTTAAAVVACILLLIAACSTRDSASNPSPPASDEAEAGTPLPGVDADVAQDRPTDSPGARAASPPAPAQALPIETPLTAKRQAADQSTLSAQEAGWATEAFAESAAARLGELADAFEPHPTVLVDVAAALSGDDFQCVPLRPDQQTEAFRDGMIVVRRGQPDAKARQLQGAEGLVTAWESLRWLAPSSGAIESHFKIIRVRMGDGGAETVVIVEMSGEHADSTRQMNATWLCSWKNVEGKPLLESIRVVDYEESEITVTGGKWFTDEAAAVLGGNTAFHRQFEYGHHYWLQRVERVQRFDTSVRNGLAIGDANGDGLDDLYVCQPPGLPNRLFIHQADGTAVDHSAAAGVDWLDQTSAALFCDLDNDGDQDLVLGTPVGILLMANDASGSYQLQDTLEIDDDVQSLSTVDFDNDGRLDIFACVYRSSMPDPRQSFLYRDAEGGGRNRLFRNEIERTGWSFPEVTNACGLGDGASRYSLAAAWEDFDLDGDQDLYIANDFGRNYLYENRAGKFVDIAEKANVMDIGSGMSVSWGDFNRDGLPDLYVGNMFSSAGQRVTSQADFRPHEDASVRGQYQRLAKGNSLFLNQGNGTFREVGEEARVERGRWAWSSLFVDLNNDGWEDLLVANGYITTEDTGDL